jgi:hypothetical protein
MIMILTGRIQYEIIDQDLLKTSCDYLLSQSFTPFLNPQTRHSQNNKIIASKFGSMPSHRCVLSQSLFWDFLSFHLFLWFCVIVFGLQPSKGRSLSQFFIPSSENHFISHRPFLGGLSIRDAKMSFFWLTSPNSVSVLFGCLFDWRAIQR